MHRLATALALLACASAQAQGSADLMKTPECASARQQLEEVLAAGGPPDRLGAAKRQAALQCFGISLAEDNAEQAGLKTDRTPLSTAPKNRVLPPPVAVEPIRLKPTPALPALAPSPGPVAGAPPGPLAIPRPPVITTCDATGCWDSEGNRYNQQGPVLMGPRGVCTQQGGLLNCP